MTDFIIILRTSEAVKTFSGNAHLSVGAGLSAAVGPFGRVAEADFRAGDGGYAACYTYSCSKGVFISNFNILFSFRMCFFVFVFFFHVVQCFLVNTTTSPILVFAGAFVGCSLEGSIVTTRTQVNSRFYGSQSLNASDILLGSLPKPPAAATLYRALSDLYQKLQW